jgi:hypothetical protein
MANKLGKIAQLDRAECRHDAIQRFSTERMTADYVARYRRAVAQRRGVLARRRERAPAVDLGEAAFIGGSRVLH